MQDEGTFLQELLDTCVECELHLRNKLNKTRSTKWRLFIKGQIHQVRRFRQQVNGHLMLLTMFDQEEQCPTEQKL